MNLSSRIRKEEKNILYGAGLFFVVSVILYLAFKPYDKIYSDVSLTLISFSLGIIGAASVSIYLRFKRVQLFLNKFPIPGLYTKRNNINEPEFYNGKNLTAEIFELEDFTFKIHSEYIWNDKIEKTTGILTFNENMDGHGVGFYQYDHQNDNGNYEALIQVNPNTNDIRIWIKYTNFYPGSGATGSYVLIKSPI